MSPLRRYDHCGNANRLITLSLMLSAITVSSLSLPRSNSAGVFQQNGKARLPPPPPRQSSAASDSYPVTRPNSDAGHPRDSKFLHASIDVDLPPANDGPAKSHTFNQQRAEVVAKGLYSSSPSGENALRTDIFSPISPRGPPDLFNWKPDVWYPFFKKSGIRETTRPMQTNKFYGSLLVREFQHNSIFTFPYSLTFTNCAKEICGMGISHVEKKTGFNYQNLQSDNPYIYGTKDVYPIILSAEELGTDTSITTDSHTAFSVSVSLAPAPDRKPAIKMPLLQGMAFITGIYNNATPVIGSNTFFDKVLPVNSSDTQPGTYKYRISADRAVWFMYVTPEKSGKTPQFTRFDKTRVKGPARFSGIVQFAKFKKAGEREHDMSAGAYPTSAKISGSVEGRRGKYTISWKQGGAPDRSLLMFALPHHVHSMDETTKGSLTKIELVTVTKGTARAITATEMTMVEDRLPTDIDFAPWSPDNKVHDISPAIRDKIMRAAREEIKQNHDWILGPPGKCVYTMGKLATRLALIVFTGKSMAEKTNANDQFAVTVGLTALKAYFSKIARNEKEVPHPLFYDSYWNGIVSSFPWDRIIDGKRLPPNEGECYGNGIYNDHMFHYGYLVYTAALIVHMDPGYLREPGVKDFVDSLARDYANPVDDAYFPFSRNFDWWHGHSWAAGTKSSDDGKDLESTSEDAMALLAIKLWGKVTGDKSMEARGDLQFAVLKRSLQAYFFWETGKNLQEADLMLPFKASGIMHENKISHTTYFGAAPVLIHGIQMVPIVSTTGYMRSPKFVREEYERWFATGRAAESGAAWRALVMADLAVGNPAASWKYFSDEKFDIWSLYSDLGTSLAWYLWYAAALGGAQ